MHKKTLVLIDNVFFLYQGTNKSNWEKMVLAVLAVIFFTFR